MTISGWVNHGLDFKSGRIIVKIKHRKNEMNYRTYQMINEILKNINDSNRQLQAIWSDPSASNGAFTSIRITTTPQLILQPI